MGKAPGPVVVSVPIAGKPSEIDITEEMRQACDALGPPVAETMLDLIAAAESEYQEQVRNNVILAGGSSAIPGFGAFLTDSLREFGGGKIRKVQDPVFVGADGGLALAKDAPKSDWDKLSD